MERNITHCFRKRSQLGFAFLSLIVLKPVAAVDNIVIDLNINSPVNTPEFAINSTLTEICPDIDPSLSNLQNVCNFISGPNAGTAEQIAQVIEELSAKPTTTGTTILTRSAPTNLLKDVASRLAGLRRGMKKQSRKSFSNRGNSGRQTDWQLSTLNPNEEGGLFSQRLSGFLNADYVSGMQVENSTEMGFDRSGQSLTAGLDYRLGLSSYLGAVSQLGKSNATLSSDDGSKLDAQQIALVGYGTHFINRWLYLEGTVSAGRQSFELTRVINLNLDSDSITATALSNVNARQIGASAGGGVELPSWQGIVSLISLNFAYSRADLPTYTEKNAGDFNLTINNQSFENLTSQFSFYISRAFSTSWAVIIPQLSATWLHEFDTSGKEIEAHFASDTSATPFSFTTRNGDPNYFQFGLDTSFILANGQFAFAKITNVRRLRDQAETVASLGFRMEF